MRSVVQSLIRAARTLRRSPFFAGLAILILAAGVGANTGIFSLANWALLRPVPGVEAGERLVLVTAQQNGGASIVPLSNPAVQRLTEPGPAFTAAAAYRFQTVDVMTAPDASASRRTAQVVTPEFFDVLGVRMRLGRGFERNEGAAESVHAVAVLADDFWRDVFDADPDVLGRTLILNGRTFTIVGVAAQGFRGPNRTDQVSIWLPASALPALMPRLPASILSMERAPVWTWLIVRRAAGVAPADVLGQLMRSEPALAQSGLELKLDTRAGLPAALRERLTETLIVVGSLVALVLLLTAANLANLLLLRASRRQHEVAVRRAIGASSGRITRELMAEGVLLAIAGALAAVATSVLAVRLLGGRALVLGFAQSGSVPIDVRVLAFAVLTALFATLLASLAAAWAARRFGAAAALRSRSVTVAGRRFRAGLVAAQIALSVALVAGAGLAARSLVNIQSRNLGFQPDGVVTFSLNPGIQGYSDADADALFRDLAREISEDPQVTATGFTWLAPLGSQRYTEQVTGGGVDDSEPIATDANMISPGLLDALGMELVEGRTFDEREYGRAERPDHGAVVINETLARALFPSGSAVGREIRMQGRGESAFEVIGVVRDARVVSLQDMPGPALFDPFGNGYRTTSATFVVRTRTTDGEVLARLHDRLRERDPRLPLLEPATMNRIVAEALIEERLLARVTSVFALLSLLLAAAGLFGLVSESVQSRMREFGVRSALGAKAHHVLVLVMRDVFTMVGIGAAAGFLLSFQIVRILQARLFGVDPDIVLTALTAVFVLAIVSVLATLGPAVRATRSDPMSAIRAEPY